MDGLQFFVRAVFAFLSAYAARLTWQRPSPTFPQAGHRWSHGLRALLGAEGAWRLDFALVGGFALLLFASLVYDALRFFLGERASHWPVIWGRRDRYELEGKIFVVVPLLLTIVCALAKLYVWVDNPGPTDAGRHSLSGWLVERSPDRRCAPRPSRRDPR